MGELNNKFGKIWSKTSMIVKMDLHNLMIVIHFTNNNKKSQVSNFQTKQKIVEDNSPTLS
jgi:transketolase N-terminal domain/subunit